MANAQYNLTKNLFLTGSINLSSDTIKAMLVDTGAYTFSQTHDFLDDVSAPARLGTPATLASKTVGSVAAGVFDAADSALGTPSTSAEAIIIYKDTGVEATSPLLWYFDTGVGGLPASAGGACTAVWNASGIFAA